MRIFGKIFGKVKNAELSITLKAPSYMARHERFERPTLRFEA